MGALERVVSQFRCTVWAMRTAVKEPGGRESGTAVVGSSPLCGRVRSESDNRRVIRRGMGEAGWVVVMWRGGL